MLCMTLSTKVLNIKVSLIRMEAEPFYTPAVFRCARHKVHVFFESRD